VRPRFWGDIRPSAPEMLGRYAPECAREFGEIFARVRPRFWGDMRLLLIESLD
jgi:hypothetical protein